MAPKNDSSDIITECIRLSSLGDELVCTLLRPLNPLPAAAVVISHGAHGDRKQFLPMAEQLARQGIVVLVPDMHGHGESEGARFHVRMAQWVPDIGACLDWLETQPFVDPARLGALGFSSGGTAVLEAAGVDQRLKALVTLDATVRSVIGAFERLFFLLLSRLGKWKERMTGQQLHVPLYPIARFSKVACDPQVNQAVLGDPEFRKAYWRYPLPGALESLVVNIMGGLNQLSLPVCVIHGEQDRLDPPSSARALFECLAGEKALHLIPDSGHMGHMDYGRQVIFDLACDWFKRHL